jgi:hypothetical protein
MRQSVGKSVKNTLAAARSAQPAIGVRAAVGWAARIRNPVLLKTASLTRFSLSACQARPKVFSEKYSRLFCCYATLLLPSEVAPGRSFVCILRLYPIRLYPIPLYPTDVHPFRHRHRAQCIAAAVTPVAAHSPQKENWKHVCLEESAWTRPKGFSTTAARALKFPRKTAPKGTREASHGQPPLDCPTRLRCENRDKRRGFLIFGRCPGLVNQPRAVVTCAVDLLL